jgi:hypothetical protein
MEALICRNLDAALRNEPKPYMFDATAGASWSWCTRSQQHCCRPDGIACSSVQQQPAAHSCCLQGVKGTAKAKLIADLPSPAPSVR